MKVVNKFHYNAPFTLTFTFAALLVLGLGHLTKGWSTTYIFTNYHTSFTDPMQYIRLFSHILGHANWEHFSSNFMMILLVGPMLEEKYGSKVLVEMTILTAFVTGLINTLFFTTGLLGASGVVFMMILLSSFANARSGQIPLTLIIVVIIFVGNEVINGLFVKDNVAQFAHITGGTCGGILGFIKTRKKGY